MTYQSKFVGLFVFALLLVEIFIAPLTVQADKLDDLNSQKSGLENNILQLEEKIKDYQKELGNKRGEINSLKNEISRINTQISKLNLEIKKTENQIYIARINIQATQQNISETVQSISEKREVLAGLIRELHKIDQENTLERLLKYDNFSDVLSQAQYLDSVQDRLNEALFATKILKENLETKEGILKKDKKNLEDKNNELAVKKTVQQTEKSRKDTLLKTTKGEETKYQQLLTQAEKEQAEFLKNLAKIEEQIAVEKNFVGYFQAGAIPPRGTKIFAWPEDDYRLTQSYGMTKYAARGVYGGKIHNGIDMTSGIGSSVKAAAGGKVVAKGEKSCPNYTSPSCNGYWGNWIALQHPGGLVTLYAHLAQPSKKGVGDEVQSSDIIGYEGSSGNSTGNHLHFSVFTEFFTYRDPRNGDLRISYNAEKTLNPLDYL